MLIICPIFNRIELLPYFLDYYSRLGASEFVLALWNGEKNPLYNPIRKQAGHVILRTSVACDLALYNGPMEKEGLNKIREEFAPKHRWYCIADLDEFCYFGDTLQGTAKAAEAKGFNTVHGTFHDRIAGECRFPPISQAARLDVTYPLASDFTKCFGANHNKIPLARSDVPIESGHHFTTGRAWANQGEVHHFKWRAGLQEQLRERDVYFTAQKLPWAGESARILKAVMTTNYLEESRYNIRPARVIGI